MVADRGGGGRELGGRDLRGREISGREACAIVYPELHTRLTAWWLVHAWRSLDMLDAGLSAVYDRNLTIGALTARGALEQAGCLVSEAIKISHAWETFKARESNIDQNTHAVSVRQSLSPVLAEAIFGTRTGASKVVAPNVLTYIKVLAKKSGEPDVAAWYSWLSDAAHPAAGARMMMGSQPLGHESGAVMTRYYSRGPLELRPMLSFEKGRSLDDELVPLISRALVFSAGALDQLLDQTLRIVDDFGLTTEASVMTRRDYFRSFVPVRGNKPCPCGRGKSTCGHHWNAPAPAVGIQLVDPM